MELWLQRGGEAEVYSVEEGVDLPRAMKVALPGTAAALEFKFFFNNPSQKNTTLWASRATNYNIPECYFCRFGHVRFKGLYIWVVTYNLFAFLLQKGKQQTKTDVEERTLLFRGCTEHAMRTQCGTEHKTVHKMGHF